MMYRSEKNDNQRAFLILFAIVCLFTILPALAESQNLDVPYVPTPQPVVERMLDVANVQPCDYVIDLGSGDGRIVIAAAKRGASGHGIDLDPKRIAEARENATEAGVDDQIIFKQENIFDTDFSRASVITMYLLPTVNLKLRPRLLSQLEPGTRVVSHSFHMDTWKPDREIIIRDKNGTTHQVYYWVIPAQAGGTWQWSSNGKNFTMSIHQTFQNISATLSDSNGDSYDTKEALIEGKRISIHAANGSHKYVFSGKVEGNKIVGMLQDHNGDQKNLNSWQATRIND